MVKKWHSVTVRVHAKAAEAVEAAFNNMDSLGSETSLPNSEDCVSVIGYFDRELPVKTAVSEINRSLKFYGFSEERIETVERNAIDDRDWLSEWKKHWKPTKTGRFVIAPSWEEVTDLDKTVIRIEPKMAFGTGTHETTKLCLRAIESYYKPGMSFYDIGTGTGILAIAAAKLYPKTAAPIAACDIDPEAVDIARENAVINDVPSIRFCEGSISEKDDIYDFVCANLTAGVIVPMLPLLTRKAGSFLVISGILNTQLHEVLEHFPAMELSDWETDCDGEWCSVIVGKG